MGGGDADAFRRVERVRREFNRLHIQPQGTTEQFNSSFLDPQAMPQQFSCFNRLVFQPHTTTQLMTQEATIFVRRVYIAGLPPSANKQTIGVFFNQVMTVIGGNTAGPDDAVCSVCMNHEQRSALVEFRVAEEKESFGPLRGFELVTDRETGNSKGYAFCVYMDTTVTDIACAAQNGFKMGDKTLIVRRANQGACQPRPEQESILLQAQQQVQLQFNSLVIQPQAMTLNRLLVMLGVFMLVACLHLLTNRQWQFTSIKSWLLLGETLLVQVMLFSMYT